MGDNQHPARTQDRREQRWHRSLHGRLGSRGAAVHTVQRAPDPDISRPARAAYVDGSAESGMRRSTTIGPGTADA